MTTTHTEGSDDKHRPAVQCRRKDTGSWWCSVQIFPASDSDVSETTATSCRTVSRSPAHKNTVF